MLLSLQHLFTVALSGTVGFVGQLGFEIGVGRCVEITDRWSFRGVIKKSPALFDRAV